MWVAERYYSLLGTSIAIQSSTEEPVIGVDELLSEFRLPEPVPVRSRHRFSLVEGEHKAERHAGRKLVYRDCSQIARTTNWRSAMAHLMATINRVAIEECAPFAVHAGVVAQGESAVAFPVDSMRGKSTLTAALLGSGFDYVSDEALCVDPETELVIPYPKPLGLSPWSLDVLGLKGIEIPFPHGSDEDAGEALIPAERIGDVSADRSLELRHVVLAEFGHDQAVLEEAAGSEAMATLLSMSFNHYRHGAAGFHLVASLANKVKTWRLQYGDPTEAAELLAERLD